MSQKKCQQMNFGSFSYINSSYNTRSSTTSREPLPTLHNSASIVTPAALASSHTRANSGCVEIFGRTSLMPSI